MFFLIPLGHEQTTLRRAPWVTIAIALICIVLQGRACTVEPPLIRELYAIEQQLEAAQSRQRHAGDAPAAELLRRQGYDEYADEVNDSLAMPGTPEPDVSDIEAEIARLTSQRDALLAQMPSMQLGYQPAHDGLWEMLTSAFAHGGLFHLLGNLLFLYVVGCNMEDRWGRWQFGVFYLSSAIVSALAYKLALPSSEVPLVGASGAIAGAMGAFLVCYGRATIRFFYAYWIFLKPRWGTFRAPAWIALLMWFAQQVALALLDEAGADGVAYSAHIGGFSFGLISAFVMKATGLDRKLDKASDAAADVGEEWVEDPKAQALLSAIDQRNPDAIRDHVAEAFAHWAREGQTDRVLTNYRAIREQHWDMELGENALRHVVHAAARKDADPLVAIDAASQLIRQHPSSALIPRAMWLAAEAQQAVRRPDLAERTLQNLVLAFPMEPLTQQARRKLNASLRPPSA